ncbi:hypothetical protein B9M81_04775 [Mycobacteroides abscessus]|nr:hypothetical protein A3O04_04675 [Mycobacteroides abscessus]ARQ63517.1 hypothetical protein CAK77_04960 [Mycobacteroides abscessus subsp. massiliense]EIU14235.1 hypothetical protein MA5S0421_1787 [Mycobacteroides abscessus 5S-0421]EIU27286.1 hypothetical protein MA5S0817_1567 [Mycobacteroides abscessus 5S-0817]EIU49739.1 hypothetical protein MA5S1215_0556 [Mycobacteroides abscessus 5S-1215]EIU93301.1 hypothetical protein MA5S0921_2268 [Mycobacteroides abscessus 5S-0921]QSM45759.1 hypotheti
MAGLLAMTALITGCSLFGQSRSSLDGNRLVRPDRPVDSPSGDSTASVEYGPIENNVKTWVPVIRDKNGNEVFRDVYDSYAPYSTLYVTWLSSRPAELWVYSGDVGEFAISAQPDGTWTKRTEPAPQEITALHP